MLMTIRQASEYLGVSIDTLRRWDKDGGLKAIHQGVSKNRYYRKEELDEFIEKAKK